MNEIEITKDKNFITVHQRTEILFALTRSLRYTDKQIAEIVDVVQARHVKGIADGKRLKTHEIKTILEIV